MTEFDHPVLRDINTALSNVANAEQHLANAKDSVRKLILSISSIDSQDEKLRIARHLYWNNPSISSQALAQAITGLPGSRGQHKFLQLIPPKRTDIICSKCGKAIEVQTREELRHVIEWAGGPTGRLNECDGCREKERHTLARVDWPMSNRIPVGQERENLVLVMESGGAMRVNVRHIFGGQDIIIGPAQIRRYLDDPDAVAAEQLGVTKNDYLEWLASSGDIQCSAFTLKGNRCKRAASGMTAFHLDDWIEMREIGGYCHLHG